MNDVLPEITLKTREQLNSDIKKLTPELLSQAFLHASQLSTEGITVLTDGFYSKMTVEEKQKFIDENEFIGKLVRLINNSDEAQGTLKDIVMGAMEGKVLAPISGAFGFVMTGILIGYNLKEMSNGEGKEV